MPSKLTKSKFKLALECPTKLYYVDKPEYANQKTEDTFLKALAEGGMQVEALARCYYPDGKLVIAKDSEESVAKTQQMLIEDSVTLFEAAIQHQNYFIRADILIKNQEHLKLIEVKAKSIDKDTTIATQKGGIIAKWKPYVADVAYQKWVLQKAYPNHRISSYLLLVDKDSLCPTDGLNTKFILKKNRSGKAFVEISELLKAEDLSTPILKEVNVDEYIENLWNEQDDEGVSFKECFQEFSQLYFEGKKYNPIPKKECGKCQFKTDPNDEQLGLKSGFKECWKQALGYNDKDFNDPTVLDLWDCKKANQFLKEGLIKLKDFSEEYINVKEDDKPGISRTERQWKQIEKAINHDNEVWMDTQSLKDEIASWTYPLHFIDFETAMLPIPFKKGDHPYQGIAFQYSHHTLDEQGCVKHAGEYLNATPGIDPSIEFARSLKSELETDSGTIFRYSNHENTYLNFILNQLLGLPDPPSDRDDLIQFIKSITKSTKDSRDKWTGERCMVDLWELIKRFYYDPLTKGSNSIKKVYPAILRRSQFLQNKYSQPIYGAENGIQSKNFNNQIWIITEQGSIKDPYSLLDRINKEAPNDDIELLFDNDQLNEGGAATIAYAKLQFTYMSDFEREELTTALLKYCELDTLAMVMIVEAWLDILK